MRMRLIFGKIVHWLMMSSLIVLAGCPTDSEILDANPVFHQGEKHLEITPVAQQTPEWCWLASAQMVFQYYGIPAVNDVSYQCGIMGAVTGPNSICFYNCAQCVFGSGSDPASAEVITAYPRIVNQYFRPNTKQLRAELLERALTPAEVEDMIDKNSPVELGITVGGPFQGQAGHAVVLIGYVAASLDQNTFQLVIDDPYPYDSTVGASQNPYYAAGATPIQPGQYLISYAAARTALQWSASILISDH